MHINLKERIADTISSRSRVIVAPLCWGLGHASRCIPIIKALLENGNKVAIASDNEALDLLHKEFPDLDYFPLPAYNIRYRYKNMVLNVLWQFPKIIKTYFKELKAAEKVVSPWNADVIISDNRFGFRSQKTKNIYITHQVNIQGNNLPETLIAGFIHKKIINKFDQCWIPDYEGKNRLAGKLSIGKGLIKEIVYLGPLSRMKKKNSEKQWDIIAILSGPEPQRSKLETLLINELVSFNDKKILVVRGKITPGAVKEQLKHLAIMDFMTSKSLNEAINSSELVISRSGYSTIMDLYMLQKRAILIPTPGQTEQEYLAKYLQGKAQFDFIDQNEIGLLKQRIDHIL